MAFRDLPIRRKLTLAIVGTTAIALILSRATFAYHGWAASRAEMKQHFTLVANIVANDSATPLDFNKDDEAVKILRGLDADPSFVSARLFDESDKVFASHARSDADKSLPDKASADAATFVGGFLHIFQGVNSGGKHVGSLYLKASQQALYSRMTKELSISALILLGAILLAFVLSARLQRFISAPILALTSAAQLISEKKDYSVRAEKQSTDELGVLTDAFNQMLEDIQERTGAVQRANESLRVQAAGMTDAAGVLATSASQIVAATRELAASAANAATAVTETTTTVEEVRQTSQVSSESAKSVSDQAQDAAEVAKGGKLAVDQTIDGMNGIQEQMAAIAECILGLSAQSQAIGEIIASVDDIAAQSKLLAVNAAIEAAKAGEEGRGFSVVAQEVKTLAGQSKQATTQVRVILSDIQKATTRAVLATEQGSKAVETGVRQSSAAGESISALAGSISRAAQAAVQIAATNRQQFVGMEQIAIAMENIKTASAQTVQSTRQVESAAQQLQDLGLKLKQLVENLKV